MLPNYCAIFLWESVYFQSKQELEGNIMKHSVTHSFSLHVLISPYHIAENTFAVIKTFWVGCLSSFLSWTIKTQHKSNTPFSYYLYAEFFFDKLAAECFLFLRCLEYFVICFRERIFDTSKILQCKTINDVFSAKQGVFGNNHVRIWQQG